jgi:hypothetical protein
MVQAPVPTYDYEVSTLIKYYDQALQKINNELNRIDLTNIQRAHIIAVQKEISNAIDDLNGKVTQWVSTTIPVAAEDGVIIAIMSLGVADTVAEAQKIVSFNRMNRDFIKTAVADTQDDLLQITQNVDRKVRTAIRQVTAEAMRSNLTQGINTTDSIKRDMLAELRKRLGDSLDTGIIDAANRRWNPKVYAEMVTRTKLAQTQRESAINEAVGRNANYGIISSHGATDACKNWEGKIVKLTADAPGAYPYYGTLPNREIFHPNCKHVISPIRRPDRYSDTAN